MDNIHYNAQMNTKHIREYCALDDVSKQLLNRNGAIESLLRAYDRILKARTIADLDAAPVVSSYSQIQYRSLDRDGWLG
jgi:magnesium chelatase family protein